MGSQRWPEWVWPSAALDEIDGRVLSMTCYMGREAQRVLRARRSFLRADVRSGSNLPAVNLTVPEFPGQIEEAAGGLRRIVASSWTRLMEFPDGRMADRASRR